MQVLKNTFITILAVTMLLTGCNSTLKNPQEQPVVEKPVVDTEEEVVPEAEEQPKEGEVTTELYTKYNLPFNINTEIDNQDPLFTVELMTEFINNGRTNYDPNIFEWEGWDISQEENSSYYSMVYYVFNSYADSVFGGLNAKVISTELLGEEKGEFDQIITKYKLVIDVKEEESILRKGQQTWIMELGYPPYGDFKAITNFMPEQYEISRSKLDPDELEQTTKDINGFCSLVYPRLFDSPKDMEETKARVGYILMFGDITGTFGEEDEYEYISLPEMERQYLELYGEELPRGEELFYEIKADENYSGEDFDLFTFSVGWGPPIFDTKIINIEHTGNEKKLDVVSYLTAIIRYTYVDDIIISATDVSDEYDGIYLEKK